jgi:phosphoglycolate phosphatase-like HAD superfamily hydrolase
MIRYLIWDVDGTLFDTYPAFARAFQAALAEFDASESLTRLERLTKVSMNHCISILAEEFGINPDALGPKFGEHYSKVSPQEQPPFPGVIALCEYIDSINGINVIVTHRRRESTHRLLAAHNMTPYFAEILTGDDDYPRKPDPTAFEAVIKNHNFDLAETLAIGDRDLDILAGQAAGVRTCFFGTDLDDEIKPDFTITDFAALHRLITAENDKNI